MTFTFDDTWKIERDPYYYPLCLQYGYDFIVDAGFFKDTSTWVHPIFSEIDPDAGDTRDILCTPFGKLTTENASPKECVLITTGGFAPVHNGHIDMLKNAKKHLEHHGWNVVNGYFAPDHDEYIQMKCDHKGVDIFSRISALNEAIKEDGNDWMFVDPWSGVFNQCAINFTEVIDRLTHYLQHYLKRHIPVFFVCGADNARFANTFINTGRCVVVGRPKYEDRFWKLEEKFHSSDRIFFAHGDTDQSSTEVRKTLPNKYPTRPNLTLITGGLPEKELDLTFAQQVKTLLSPYFWNVNLRWKTLERDWKQFDSDIICLDKSTRADNNLNISRCYDLFGGRSNGYVARPGYASIQEQLKKIPTGDYRLYDSDSATGGTLKFVTEEAAKYGINITDTVTLMGDLDTEILDVEDFLLGTGDGLIVRLPNGKMGRAPYMLPYVDCRARCSVIDPVELSIDMWKLNYNHFCKYERYLGQYPNYFELFSLIGFAENSSMSSICEWHIWMLETHLTKS